MTKDQSIQKEELQPAASSFLSRAECNFMRGFAILIIIIDNFTHALRGVWLDNEYRYSTRAVNGFLNNLAHPDGLLPYNFISFYCPYGVMLFIFLSGYGLTLKYEKGNGQGVSCKDYLFSHYSKLFTMHLKGFALFLTIFLLFNPTETIDGSSVLLQSLLLINLSPYHMVYPGPYWFFGMILEMYVIYRLVIYRRSDVVTWVLVAVSLVTMALFEPISGRMVYLRINCFLAILPFCMGVLAARHLDAKWLSLNKPLACLGWFVLAFILLTLVKFNFYTWLIMPIFVVATAVTIVKLMTRSNLLNVIFGWLGGLSGVLFVVHPTVREFLIHRVNENGHYAGGVCLYLIITFGLSLILRPVFSGKKK
ncbi:MAG: acyltransferase family protein [Prevotella sp.]|nr:acyltransferase family protein [Prevotella sp.]